MSEENAQPQQACSMASHIFNSHTESYLLRLLSARPGEPARIIPRLAESTAHWSKGHGPGDHTRAEDVYETGQCHYSQLHASHRSKYLHILAAVSNRGVGDYGPSPLTTFTPSLMIHTLQ